jgi:hypothetical protein
MTFRHVDPMDSPHREERVNVVVVGSGVAGLSGFSFSSVVMRLAAHRS